MRKQPIERDDPTLALGALAAGGGGGVGPASLILRGMGARAGRPALWTVLALAVAAALLMSYVQLGQGQLAQAQASFPSDSWIYEVVLTPPNIDPGAVGSGDGAAVSLKVTYVSTTTTDSHISNDPDMEVPAGGRIKLTFAATSSAVGFGHDGLGPVAIDANNPPGMEQTFPITQTASWTCETQEVAVEEGGVEQARICTLPFESNTPTKIFAAAQATEGDYAITVTVTDAFTIRLGSASDAPEDSQVVNATLPQAIVRVGPPPTPTPAPTPTPSPTPMPGPVSVLEVDDLSAERGSGEVRLRWSDPDDASITSYEYRYKVRDGDYGDPQAMEGSDRSTTEYTVTGLVNGRRHTFQIRAVVGEGTPPADGGWSEEASATPARPQPGLDDPSGPGDPLDPDDPDAPPEPPAPPPPDRTSSFADAGDELKSRPLSPSRPVRATVVTPVGGFISITVESNEQRLAPPGYTLEGSTVNVTAPSASADAPIELTFEVRTLVASEDLAVLRDGVPVEDCTVPGGVAEPDPCVSSRLTENGVVTVTVLTSQASEWQFGVALEPDPTPTPEPTVTPTPEPTSTPEPTATPPPTATPTPEPTATPTPEPTSTPEPTATPPPTATPLPTSTPRPTSTPTPVPPQPTSTPVPPMDEGGLNAGLIVLIVVVALVVVGGGVYVLRRR